MAKPAPSTRYQGSKLKLLPWIWEKIAPLEFDSAIDLFGGSGSVSYLLKRQRKRVVYNDYLRFNQIIAQAILENSHVTLAPSMWEPLFARDPRRRYGRVIEEQYEDIYFTTEENRWLDVTCQNIAAMEEAYARSLAWYALFQACLAKRPYNLFHRKNLYMRLSDVKRSFGNKATWDTPFEALFARYAEEANAAVFDSGRPCRALCGDALTAPTECDLAYLDPPYLNAKGSGVDYHAFYHFLEGAIDYEHWASRINLRRKHRPLQSRSSPWSKAETIHQAFAELFARQERATLVVSYRSDGTPTVEELKRMLERHKRTVTVHRYGVYKYALSTNAKSKEVLLIAR